MGGKLTGSLNGTSAGFNSMTGGGNSVVTATALKIVVTASGMNYILAGYLQLFSGTLTGNLACKQLLCMFKVDTGTLTCPSLSMNGQSIVDIISL